MKKWDELTLREKYPFMSEAIASGVKDLDLIKALYEEQSLANYGAYGMDLDTPPYSPEIDDIEGEGFRDYFKQLAIARATALNKKFNTTRYTPEDLYGHFIDSPDYNWRRWYNLTAPEERLQHLEDPLGHVKDVGGKTYLHPTASVESPYSGYVNPYNPLGIVFGSWPSDNRYVFSEDLLNNGWLINYTLNELEWSRNNEDVPPAYAFDPQGGLMLREVEVVAPALNQRAEGGNLLSDEEEGQTPLSPIVQNYLSIEALKEANARQQRIAQSYFNSTPTPQNLLKGTYHWYKGNPQLGGYPESNIITGTPVLTGSPLGVGFIPSVISGIGNLIDEANILDRLSGGNQKASGGNLFFTGGDENSNTYLNQLKALTNANDILLMYYDGYKLPTEYADACARFSNDLFRQLGYNAYGNAWEPNDSNIIFDGYTFRGADNPVAVAAKPDAFDLRAIQDRNANASYNVLKNFSRDTLDISLPYQVNMYYKNSPNTEKAFNGSKNYTGTHTGIALYDPTIEDWVVIHNSGGTVHRQLLKDLLGKNKTYGVTAITQPARYNLKDRAKLTLRKIIPFANGGNLFARGGNTKSESFDDAYAKAKQNGDKTFVWDGRTYITKDIAELNVPTRVAGPSTTIEPIITAVRSKLGPDQRDGNAGYTPIYDFGLYLGNGDSNQTDAYGRPILNNSRVWRKNSTGEYLITDKYGNITGITQSEERARQGSFDPYNKGSNRLLDRRLASEEHARNINDSSAIAGEEEARIDLLNLRAQMAANIINGKEKFLDGVFGMLPSSKFNHSIMGGVKTAFDPNYTYGNYKTGLTGYRSELIGGLGDLINEENPELNYALNLINPSSLLATALTAKSMPLQTQISRGRTGTLNVPIKPQTVYRTGSGGLSNRVPVRGGQGSGGYRFPTQTVSTFGNSYTQPNMRVPVNFDLPYPVLQPVKYSPAFVLDAKTSQVTPIIRNYEGADIVLPSVIYKDIDPWHLELFRTGEYPQTLFIPNDGVDGIDYETVLEDPDRVRVGLRGVNTGNNAVGSFYGRSTTEPL